jgi:hypothetical protein
MLEAHGGPERKQAAAAIPAGDALHALRHDRALTYAMLRVPFPMVYFIVFVFVVFAHIPSSGLFRQSNALYSTLASSGDTTVTSDSPISFFNIATPGDVFDWLELTFAPSVFVTQDYNEQDLPTSKWGRVATYNQVIGAVRLEVISSAEETCDNQLFLNAIYSTCRNDDILSSSVTLLSVRMNSTEAVAAIEALKQAGSWIDDLTQSLEVTVVTFNGDISSYAVTTLTMDFQDGGFIDLSAATISAKSKLYMSARPYVSDALLVVCFFFVLGRQITDLWRNRTRVVAHVLMDFWHTVDYMSTILIVAFYAIWAVIFMTNRNSSFRDKIAALSATDAAWRTDSEESKDMEDVIAKLNRIAHLTIALRLVATATIIVMGLRILDRFRFHPRLNLLSQTVALSLSKFGAFFVVCVVVIVTFALSGHVIFGDRASEFSTVKASLESCVNILFGNFDYESIKGLYVPVSIIYYWSYIIIASLILLNMMLAIVLDTYGEVSEQAFSDNTVTSLGRMFYIVIHDVLLWCHDLCGRRPSATVMTRDSGGCDLTHRDIIFRGRIRPDVLEVVLERLVEDSGDDSMSLTPPKLRSLFSNAIVTEAEALATLDYLAHGLVTQAEEDVEGDEGESKLSKKDKRKQHRAADTTVVLTSPAAAQDPWSTFVGSEVQFLASRVAAMEQKLERVAELERKLDLVLARLMRQ